MGDTTGFLVGDRGGLVVPAEMCERLGWRAGSRLVALQHEDGIKLISRDALLTRVQEQFRDAPSLVDELIAERRAEVAQDHNS
ncbi:AbrB/MazE/SpoVT family DNA-binding domain-containing protein [Klenkia sp. PcliD-1-E]|uniref:AbrB/MazE/SpoVT family DNA-binding domain-containing protein n=1 Tax=Klenkia sp. PcliD-1-E TaxID=2954492 RepID=UPI00209753A9|nr:AbrB/MazE/SpoVT family DNA-binding domain-containing protein [Klenkia sp. PcliD-1-E]MCO7221177.1 AbrB/MazE/SpoVT family DNA-binding domain-containing protein [Klenkia sp. PcliD-1-E]